MTTIHYINHNFSDWDSQTKHMSRLERSIYLDLRTLYFSDASANNGKIDVGDFELLCYRLSCRTEEEISALKLLLKDKFKKNGNSYRHADWDRQIKAIQWEIKKGNTSNTIGNDGNAIGNDLGNTLGNDLGNTGKPLSNAERTAKTKAERKKLLSDLSSVGVETPVNTPIAELRALHERHFANAVGNDDGNTIGNDGNGDGNTIGNDGNGDGNTIGNDGNGDGNTIGNDGNAQKPSNNQEPLTKNQEPKKEAIEIFNFWCTTMGKDKSTKLSPKRESKILARLKDGYTTDKIKTAIVACSKSDWHMANSHNDIELICRDVEHLDKFLDMSNKSQQPRFGGKNDPLAVNQHWQNNGNQVVGGFVIPQAGVQKW